MPTFELQCNCGNIIIVTHAKDCNHLSIYCKKCEACFIDLNEQNAKTFISESPDAPLSSRIDINKIYREDLEKQKFPRPFGNYTLESQLGQGAMGEVYLAIHNKTQEKVALKVLHKPDNMNLLNRFLQELTILSDLDHPNIVRLSSQGNHDGVPFIAMEYIEGTPFTEYLKAPLAPHHSAQIIYHVLDALDYAEKFNIVHRDIKPANIMITKKGRVKVIDLGLGKVTGTSYGLTKTGDVMGTPFYMAPEQFIDIKKVDLRADIYAVGATLYHSLCAYPPYSEYKGISGIMTAKIRNDYIKLSERGIDLPEEIIQIVEKAMSHEVDKRYSHPSEMKKEILDFYQSQKQK